MIAEYLMNSFTDEAKRSILVHRKRFQYKTTDRSTVNDGIAKILVIRPTPSSLPSLLKSRRSSLRFRICRKAMDPQAEIDQV
jgi:hypothetical protein